MKRNIILWWILTVRAILIVGMIAWAIMAPVILERSFLYAHENLYTAPIVIICAVSILIGIVRIGMEWKSNSMVSKCWPSFPKKLLPST